MKNKLNYEGMYLIGDEEMYLSYVNDFLTIERFAEYYGITEEQANEVINKGRKINHSK
jgi:plasmid maintenance system antidote protein VapI